MKKNLLLNLKEKDKIIGPLDFHDRFNFTMPEEYSILQHQLDDLVQYTDQHHMVLNQRKTKCLPFINSRTKDFMPQLRLNSEEYLEVIYSLKLVGLIITIDLRWQDQVTYTVKSVNSVLWQLTRFKNLGAPQDKLLTFCILTSTQSMRILTAR